MPSELDQQVCALLKRPCDVELRDAAARSPGMLFPSVRDDSRAVVSFYEARCGQPNYTGIEILVRSEEQKRIRFIGSCQVLRILQDIPGNLLAFAVAVIQKLGKLAGLINVFCNQQPICIKG